MNSGQMVHPRQQGPRAQSLEASYLPGSSHSKDSRGSLPPFQSVQGIELGPWRSIIPQPRPRLLWVNKYLRHCVGRGVHEFRKVHGALSFILGYVDGLDWGEAWVGITEVLQPQPPLHKTHVGPFHKHLQAAASYVCVTVKDGAQGMPTHGLLDTPCASGAR